MNILDAIEMALSFPEVEQNPHFDRIAFKVKGKRIFSTLHEKSVTMNVKLSTIEQPVFCSYENKGIYPVANKFGEQGWTTFELKSVPSELVFEALRSAYAEVFQKIKG